MLLTLGLGIVMVIPDLGPRFIEWSHMKISGFDTWGGGNSMRIVRLVTYDGAGASCVLPSCGGRHRSTRARTPGSLLQCICSHAKRRDGPVAIAPESGWPRRDREGIFEIAFGRGLISDASTGDRTAAMNGLPAGTWVDHSPYED